ncbi:MAG TPA: hypothetical protein VF131_23185 [Blastocatellia bacterium]|nr:hypothetical protein [Blastocatellia bacterium]
MHRSKSANRLLSLLLVVLLLTSGLLITRQATAALTHRDDDEQESLTLDGLLGADIYMLYGELRNVGAQAQAGGLMSLVEPLIPLLGGVPKELTGITTFISKHSNTLSRSRMIIAAMPVKPELPQVILAVEMASPDAAEQFEPEFRQFLSSIIMDANKRSPGVIPSFQHGKPPPFAIKRAGALLIVAEADFEIKSIRPEEGNLLSGNLNFQAARNRFYSEPLFIYFDVGLSERALKQRYGSNTGEHSPPPDAIRISEPESPVTLPPSEPPVIKQSSPSQTSQAAAKPSPRRPRKTRASAQPGKAKAAQPNRARSRPAKEAAPPSAKSVDTATSEALNEGEQQDFMSSTIMPLVIGGNRVEKEPDVLAIALAYEADALIVRILIAREPGLTAFAIPFISMLACGSPVAPEGASYVPADTEVFLTASVDLPQMFDLILAMRGSHHHTYRPQVKVPSHATITELEKKLGLKIKDEFLTAFGTEVAFSLPAQSFLPPTLRGPAQAQANQTAMVMLISVQNKEVVKAKISPVLEALGLRGRGEKGVTEKRGAFEISAYNKVAVAFINNFLILTSDLPAMRRVVDAVATNQTLAATRDYHDYMRWQPRQTLAQVYVSSAVIKGIFDGARQSAEKLDDDIKQFFSEFPFVAEPVTYSATSDATGPVYELRLPKGFIAMLLAQLNSDEKRAQVFRNEHAAMFVLENIKEAQSIYRNEKGRYATLEELMETGVMEKDGLDGFGYKFEIRVAGGRYEALATPTEYGKTGLRSFYMDESGVLKAGDHGGRPATSADKPLSGNPNAN